MLRELERRVANETKKAAASHDFNHLLRVAKGAKWFCDILGVTEHEKQVAYAAGLLHDIIRPATEKYDPLKDAMKKAEEIMKELNMGKTETKEVLEAIHAHHYPNPKKKAGYSVFLADKLLEALGAYIVFRRAVFMGESPDFAGMGRMEATTRHWTARINKWHPSGYEKRFAKLIDYQFSWCQKFLDAFRRGEQWSLNLNDAGFEAGKKGTSTDKFIASFKPGLKEEKEFKEEALSYIRGDKFSMFTEMII